MRTATFVLAAAGLVAVGCGKSYDLRSVPAAGDVLRVESTLHLRDGSLVADADGEHVEGAADLRFHEVDEIDLLVVENDRPTRLKVTRLASDSVATIAGEAQDGSDDVDPLVGRSILFEAVGTNWSRKLVGGEPDEQQDAAIRNLGEPWVDDYVPAGKLTVGESWTLTGRECARLLGDSDATGTAKVRLQQIVDYAGEPCAMFSVQVDSTSSMVVDPQTKMSLTLSGEGHIYRSLAKKHDLHTEISGTATMEILVVQDEKPVTLRIKGPLVLTLKSTKD